MASASSSNSSEDLKNHQIHLYGYERTPCNMLSKEQMNNSNSSCPVKGYNKPHLKEKQQTDRDITKSIKQLCSSVSSNTSKKSLRGLVQKFKRLIRPSSQDLMGVESIIESMIDKVALQKGSKHTNMLRRSEKKIAGLNKQINLLQEMKTIINSKRDSKVQCLQRLSTLRSTPDRTRRSMELGTEINFINRKRKMEENESFVGPSSEENQRNNDDPMLCVESNTDSIEPDFDENQRPQSPDEGFVDGDSRSPSPVCCTEDLGSIDERQQSSENSLNRKREMEENESFVGPSSENKQRSNHDLPSMQSKNLKKSDIRSKTPLIIAGSCAVMAVAISVYLEMVMVGAIAAICISVLGVARYCYKERMNHEEGSKLVSVDKGVKQQQANAKL